MSKNGTSLGLLPKNCLILLGIKFTKKGSEIAPFIIVEMSNTKEGVESCAFFFFLDDLL
jgi:hypothetical protein